MEMIGNFSVLLVHTFSPRPNEVQALGFYQRTVYKVFSVG